MKKVMMLILIGLCFVCTSCNNIVPNYKEPTENETFIPDIGSGSEDGPQYDVLPDVEYNEIEDSLEGLTEEEILDLSGLKEAIDSIGNNFASKTKVYFNSLAVERVIYNYKKPFYCQITSLYDENYVYQYNETFEVNTGYVNKNNNIYTVALEGIDLASKLNSTIKEESLKILEENISVSQMFFTLDKLNSSYVDKYGAATLNHGTAQKPYYVDYNGWTRISHNKYKCDRPEVIEDFLKICSPGFDNGGTYMTYRYVTVEINPDNSTALRLRLYASPTQIGKLIQSHKLQENTNWYLLFAEAYIYDVGKIEPNAFENLYI